MLVAADLSTSGAASEPRRYVMNDLQWHSAVSQQGMSSRLCCYGIRAKHLWRDGRLVWRPALESSLDGGAPLAAPLASRAATETRLCSVPQSGLLRGPRAIQVAADAPQIRLLLWVVLELQLRNVQLQPRCDERADRGLRRTCTHMRSGWNAQLLALNAQHLP